MLQIKSSNSVMAKAARVVEDVHMDDGEDRVDDDDEDRLSSVDESPPALVEGVEKIKVISEKKKPEKQ